MRSVLYDGLPTTEQSGGMLECVRTGNEFEHRWFRLPPLGALIVLGPDNYRMRIILIVCGHWTVVYPVACNVRVE